ncbi:Phosphatidylglycerophosphatase and protein-tyrosine phosphatase 1, partial [Quaeritorhiza haematococci]
MATINSPQNKTIVTSTVGQPDTVPKRGDDVTDLQTATPSGAVVHLVVSTAPQQQGGEGDVKLEEVVESSLRNEDDGSEKEDASIVAEVETKVEESDNELQDGEEDLMEDQGGLWGRVRFSVSLAYNRVTVQMLGKYWSRKLEWYNRLDETLLLGALPNKKLVSHLHTHENVLGIVNLCREYAGDTKYYASLGVKQLRLPTTDFTTPDFESIVEGVK